MKDQDITVRKWLVQNNYDDVALLIDEVMKVWVVKGVHTRRNWWDVLAGGKNGKPRTIEGIQFPILKAAQIRKGIEVSENAICRNNDEYIPEIRKNGRWIQNKN